MTKPLIDDGLYAAEGEPADVLIREAHVLDPRTGLDEPRDVLVRNGRIAEIAPPGSLEPPAAIRIEQATGRHLFPAFVDPHVHLRTPGQEYKEDIATGTAAAAAGGYCAIVAMPNTNPTVDEPAIMRSLVAQARATARIPTGFMAAITRSLEGSDLTEMAALREAGAIGFTDDGRPVTSAGMLRKALQYQRLAGGLIALHEEDPSLSADGVMHEGPISARLGMAGIPSLSESTMVARDAALALLEDARVHFQHLSCVESVEALAAAKARGARVTGEASPHHLTLTDEAVRSLDTRFKMNPPLRSEQDRRAIIQGLKDGTIDCVATDHAPHAAHEKEVPFEEAPMGTTGLETAFAAIYTDLVTTGELPLATLIERMTAGAAVLGINHPEIAPGAPANLVLIDLEATWEVGAAGYHSRSSNCCFDGRTFNGRTVLTIAGGTVVHRERRLGAVPDQGQRLQPASTGRGDER